jgi:phosphate transport system permease protein
MNNLQRNKIRDKAFKYFGVTCTFFGIFILGVFLFGIINDGVSRINWDFLTNLPSYRPKRAGILTAWTGTLWIFGLTAIIAIPLGIAAAIYLEEYGKKSWFANLLEINITNLAGVPSII